MCSYARDRNMTSVFSAAEMRFATLEESETAFLDLKSELASMEVDVYHPSPRSNFNSATLRREYLLLGRM